MEDMAVLGTVRVVGAVAAAVPGGFWSAVDVWVQRPQVVNKRLCGARTEEEENGGGGPAADLREERELRAESAYPRVGRGDGVGRLRLSDILSELSRDADNADVLSFMRGYEEAGASGFHIVLRTLIPKSNPHYGSVCPRKELVIKDVEKGAVTFIPLEEDERGLFRVKKSNIYQIQLAHVKDDEWSLSVSTLSAESWDSDGIVYPKTSWLRNELLSKLAKWTTENKKSEFKNTLSLISVARYSELYQELKAKYKEMVKVWPEVTDPEKFVYEDVAIATYLLLLWEEDRVEKRLSKKQSFLDLGCGNGLLVHILSNEGHPGRGIDVRKRKIWDMYGSETHLEECAITPSNDYLFPEIDWLIGNHSDELTPWLPVIAARSSYSCCYFVLPCCFFDFYGKYSRRQSKKTQYREYLDFVTEVGHKCGFNVEEDCLRIPSTKRVCLIGKSRTYSPTQEASVDEQRCQYINQKRSNPAILSSDTELHHSTTDSAIGSGYCNDPKSVSDTNDKSMTLSSGKDMEAANSKTWISEFQPRGKTEQIRNCASLPRDFIDRVVLKVACSLLTTNENDQDGRIYAGSGDIWNRGISLSLREIADLLGKPTLQRLKNEFGGLQTLLRNNYQVFEAVHQRRRLNVFLKRSQRFPLTRSSIPYPLKVLVYTEPVFKYCK
ncbi:probable tRNA (uracil-O(2)-)-methyltransferase isoform X2 [Rhinatrema bivittatum]|uniref:probable tRNA (uracil-O(2)-)-methyltransferase isoform X2 n=1 Tax=Rhinatrema bivittatum TaxID=194408 RepID=UPI00112BCA86|nr:probable tRNA (uracil-O(2)-)-methyltransferase isoform X2 [Rhinatrema bivittatum]